MATTIEATGPALDEKDLEQFESEISHRLPKEYRDFMLQYNGGRPRPGVFDYPSGKTGSIVQLFHRLEEGTNSLRFKVKQLRSRIPPDLIPIATCMVGNVICIGVEGERRGKIFYWDHEREAMNGSVPDYSNVTLLADSFDQFLAGLRESSY